MNTTGELAAPINPYEPSLVQIDRRVDSSLQKTLLRLGALYALLIAIEVPVLHAIAESHRPSFDSEFTGTTMEDIQRRVARIVEDVRKIPYDF